MCLIDVLLPLQTIFNFFRQHILAPALSPTRNENTMIPHNALRLAIWWIYWNLTSVSRTASELTCRLWVALERVFILPLWLRLKFLWAIVIAGKNHWRLNLFLRLVWRFVRIRIFLFWITVIILTFRNLHTVTLVTWLILGDWRGLIWRIRRF